MWGGRETHEVDLARGKPINFHLFGKERKLWSKKRQREKKKTLWKIDTTMTDV